jgi:exonuclease III
MPRQQQREGGNQQQQQHVRKHLLRIATHNVRGMHQERMTQLRVRMWMDLDLDIVCVQETHVRVGDCAAVQGVIDAAAQAVDLHHGGFQAVWACNSQQEAARSAGVAVLIRRSLLSQQDMVIAALQAAPHPSGRVLSIPMRWGGHTLHVVAVYLPNLEPEQKDFIESVLQPVVHGRQGCVVLGDWNFVPSAALDRVSSAAGGGVHHAAAAQCFTAQCPDLVDVF